ncbi:uncharacterized protein LOC143254344 [Tachypleus tridentatus]|uniref:uncharacterized protein LOC143254344 n=1 Tax=Tachypleus tridentatus TaxID=6853 RepID=UPI003FD3EC8A
MKIILLVLVLTYVQHRGRVGSSCPKEDISPWFCTDIPIRHLYTIILCNKPECKLHLEKPSDFARNQILDKVILFNITRDEGENSWKLTLPPQWLSMSRVRELEIRNTPLSNCFLCNNPFVGQQLYLKKLVFSNCSLKGKLCNQCETLLKTKITTTAKPRRRYGYYIDRDISTTSEPEYEYKYVPGGVHMNGLKTVKNLEILELSFNEIDEIYNDTFPVELSNLETLVLSHNVISVLSTNSFTNLVSLKEIDLSYNKLEHLSRDIFSSPASNLQVLNLKGNGISVLPENIFSLMPVLREANLALNFLQFLPLRTWNHTMDSIKVIDVSGNFIICDCDIKWIATKHQKVTGYCSEPWNMSRLHLKQGANSLTC